MGLPLPEATTDVGDRSAVLLGYLDYFRAAALARVADLPDDLARAPAVPSGWSPLELLHHLTWVERRWLQWGFRGEPLPDPWGDEVDGRWAVPDGVDLAGVADGLVEQGRVTRRVVTGHDLAERGRPGPRWDGARPATLERVLLHLLQEYARHVGHLDITRELLDGTTGE